jgi:hypothetical protein
VEIVASRFRYLRKFRDKNPRGEMSRDEFEGLFQTSFPNSVQPRFMTDAVFGHLPKEQEDVMDFKVKTETDIIKRVSE